MGLSVYAYHMAFADAICELRKEQQPTTVLEGYLKEYVTDPKIEVPSLFSLQF